jgi:hypothetical protein
VSDKKFIPVITYLNPDRDQEILLWLKAQPSKSAAIRDVLQHHIQSASPSVGQEVPINLEVIQAAVAGALTEHFDITLFRQLVEAAIGSALAGLTITTGSIDTSQNNEADAMLDALDDHLIWD